jgi:hypothetical protein
MVGSEKFDTCQHKSTEQYKRQVRICCNNYQEIEGFDCTLREIFPLNPDHCTACTIYLPKE